MPNTATAKHRAPATDHSTGLVRWVFYRGHKVLTCEVRFNGDNSHEVSVVPHWNVGASIIERFDHAWTALRRHAEISRDFRQAGWAMVHERAN